MSTATSAAAVVLLAAVMVNAPSPAFADETADASSVLFARARMETYPTASPYALRICAEGDSLAPGTWTLRANGATTAPAVIDTQRTVAALHMPLTTCVTANGAGGIGSAAGTVSFLGAGGTPVAVCYMNVTFVPAAEEVSWICVESYPLAP
ncbi:MAG TPA: hypothetical protein VNQ77_03230 [Frankiaceae bacterium]|nr:hypothetical protein [Frankiaceae bacterium]